MRQIQLRYGHGSLPFDFDEDRFQVLAAAADARPLTDIEIGKKLDRPTGSLPVEELVSPGDSVLIVVPDATRQTGSGQVVNLLVRRLIANGAAPFDLTIIFATGIHRPVTDAEKKEIVTPFIAQRIKTAEHSPRDLARLVSIGETSGGISVQLNRALIEHDHVILVGGITFHYFAGFTGGRKLICPGLASSRTIAETHKLAFDCETLDRRSGVAPGLLDGNAVHEVFAEAASKIPSVFCISTFVNDAGEVTNLFCGDLAVSHRAACAEFAGLHSVPIAEKRGLVVASCGGFPHDINLIQAHKTLDAAAHACRDGGTIVLLAECSEGLGRADFLRWFDVKDSRELAENLCRKYEVNGQTAWSLMLKAERFDVRVITSLDDAALSTMRLTPAGGSVAAAAASAGSANGYIIPNGGKLMIV